MNRLIERCCGRLHASTKAEWFEHDSGSGNQIGSGKMPVTQVAMTSESNFEISVDQVGKDASRFPTSHLVETAIASDSHRGLSRRFLH